MSFGAHAASLSPLNLLWPESSKPTLSSPETLRFYQPKAWAEVRYENWLDEKDARRETKANHRTKQFGVLLAEQQSQARLDLLVLQQDIRQGWQEQAEREQFSISHAQSSTDIAFNFDSRWFGFGGFSENNYHGWSIQFNPFPVLKLFYKEQGVNQAWLVDAGFNKQDSEDFFAESKSIDYAISTQLEVACDYQITGVVMRHAAHWLLWQKQETDNALCRANLLEGYWALSDKHAFALRYYSSDFSGVNQFLFIDNRIQGAHLLNVSSSDLSFSWSIKTQPHSWRLSFVQKEFFSEGSAGFNARALGGVWSSLILGNGYVEPYIDIRFSSFGLSVTKNQTQGWYYQASGALGKLDLDVRADYRLDYFPFGTFRREEARLDVESAILLLADFGLGYRWRNWRVFYQMQQPIPLRVKNRAGEDKVPSDPSEPSAPKESESWTDYFKKLPPGNRQTLSIEYVF